MGKWDKVACIVTLLSFMRMSSLKVINARTLFKLVSVSKTEMITCIAY